MVDEVLCDIEYDRFLAEYLFGFDFLIEEVSIMFSLIIFVI